jgi:hypothetical protein
MKKFTVVALVAATLAPALTLSVGCARPGEFGYTPAYTTKERANIIARGWDNDGKMLMDDVDSILLLRPQSRLTPWNIR